VFSVNGKALTGTTATLTTSTTNTISVGDTVAVSIGDPRFDGTYTVTAATGTTFSYAVNPAALTSTVTNKAVASGAVTLTTSAAHNLNALDTVNVNIGALGFDGTFTVTAVPTSTTFSYAAPSFATTAWSVDASGNTATLTTASAHGLNVGDSVNVSGFPTTGKIDLGFLNRGPVTVTAAVPSTKTFSYAVSGVPNGQKGNNGAGTGTVVIAVANSSSASGTATVTAVKPVASGTVTVTPASASVTIASGWENTHGPGVYCLTGGSGSLLTIGANGETFNGYTFFGPNINLSSKNMTITNAPPASGQPPTVFDAYTGNFTVSGQSDTITGDIFAPTGNILISGGGASSGNGGSGFMESLKLIIAGNLANYNGTGPLVGANTITTTTVTPVSTDLGTTSAGTTVNSVSTSTSTVNGTTSTTFSTTPITIFGSTTPGTTVTSTTGTNVGLGE